MFCRWRAQQVQLQYKARCTINIRHLEVSLSLLNPIQFSLLAEALTSTANVAAVAQNALAPFLNGLSGNSLAALAGISNSTNSLNVASSLNAANTLIQQQLGTLLATSPVILVSNLDENVSCFPELYGTDAVRELLQGFEFFRITSKNPHFTNRASNPLRRSATN